MNKFMKIVIIFIVTVISTALLLSCSDDDPGPKDTKLRVLVVSSIDTLTAVQDAVVSVYDDLDSLIKTDITDEDGKSIFEIDGGDYYLKADHTGFDSVPTFYEDPEVFSVPSERTTEQVIIMHPVTILKVIVKDDSKAVIPNSNVVVYSAETGQSVMREFTNAEGICYFNLNEGNYYLEIQAQGFDPSPAPTVTPVPFFVTREDTTAQERMIRDNMLTDIAVIKGHIQPPMSNFLVLADDTGSNDSYATVSGPDGFFILYNLPFGHYELDALKSGYHSDALPNTLIDTPGQEETLDIYVSEITGSSISGSLTFLATTDTLDVDIVLRDPQTMSVVPGLRTKETSGDYSFSGIPGGDYIAWASLENDGYVMDPDWIFKNPGALNVTFPDDNNTTLPFSITGSVQIESPTNTPDSIYAAMADSATPTFSWIPYPSTKEYIIEVRDINGNIIWGGFDASGVVQHTQILKTSNNPETVVFNFDGSASEDLIPGKIYQWKIYADDNTDLNVQTLISSSEDLMGLFQIPEPVK